MPRTLTRLRDSVMNNWEILCVVTTILAGYHTLWLDRNYVPREEFETHRENFDSYSSEVAPVVAADAARIIEEKFDLKLDGMKRSLTDIKRQLESSNAINNQNYMMIMLHISGGGNGGGFIPVVTPTLAPLPEED